MEHARIVIGGFVFMIGILTLVRTLFENASTLNDSPLQLLDFSKMPDVAVVVIVEMLIIAAGIVVLATRRTSQSPNK